MSKFFITNRQELFNEVKRQVENSAYKIAFENEGSGILALSTKKLSIDNINGTGVEDGFITITGTMSWGSGEPITRQVLQKIFCFFDGDINAIRKNSIGNYASSIYKDGVLYVFGEITGFYNIYYYRNNNEWLISNSLYDMALVLKQRLTINKFALIESTVQDGILLNDTYYNEISRLSGFNHLKITSTSFEVIEESCLYPMATGTTEEKVERYKETSISYGKRITSAYGTPVISMTGGLDARMVLSSFLAAGIKPHLYYGTGNSFITNTYQQDKEIDLLFAEKFDLTFYDESWSTPSPMDRYWDKYLKLYGFYYDTYAGSDPFMESIINNPCKIFNFGYCGELLRNLPWIEKRNSNYFTLDEYINDFYIPESVKRAIIQPDEYISYIRSKYIRICDYYHLDTNRIANEDIFYLSIERRKSADSALLNHVNMMKYCSYLLGQYENLVAGRIYCDEAANSSFMLRCLDALNPEVLEIPVFSHCTIRKFYRDRMMLEDQVRPLSKTRIIRNKIKKQLPLLHSLYMMIKGDRRAWRFKNDEQIYQYVLKRCAEYDNYSWLSRERIDDPRRLINYLMKLYAIKTVRQ